MEAVVFPAVFLLESEEKEEEMVFSQNQHDSVGKTQPLGSNPASATFYLHDLRHNCFLLF